MSIYNEYGKIKQVILGISPILYPSSDLPKTMIDKLDFYTTLQLKLSSILFKNRPLTNPATQIIIDELEDFNSVLKNHKIDILRLEPIVPLENEHPGLMQMYARDPVFIIGKKAIVANMAIKMRMKEYRGYDHILKSLEKNGFEIIKMPKDDRFILEGGDVIVDHPYVYAGHGTYISTLEGINWLQNILKNEFEVIPIEIKDKSIMHLDCSMTIIGKNRGIIHKDSLGILPRNFEYFDFIEVKSTPRKQLGANVFVINPDTIVVQKRHKKLISDLETRGYEVYPLNFSSNARIGGAFRCTTCPIDREYDS
jgi:N-dimethylarginine dimethylaminohydrolase